MFKQKTNEKIEVKNFLNTIMGKILQTIEKENYYVLSIMIIDIYVNNTFAVSN